MHGEATAVSTAVLFKPFLEIDLEKYVDIFEKCRIRQKLNLGTTTIYQATHPDLGEVVLVDAGNERVGLITF